MFFGYAWSSLRWKTKTLQVFLIICRLFIYYSSMPLDEKWSSNCKLKCTHINTRLHYAKSAKLAFSCFFQKNYPIKRPHVSADLQAWQHKLSLKTHISYYCSHLHSCYHFDKQTELCQLSLFVDWQHCWTIFYEKQPCQLHQWPM